MFSTKTGAARLLLGTVILLIVAKALVSWLTGSISIIAQTTDSLLDLFAGIITLSAIRIASRPADDEHPYGHGKVEDIAGLVQGGLVFTAGGLIIYSSILRILEGSTIELTEVGMGVMLLSIIVSLFLSRHLLKVAKATNSPALEANAKNITADIYSALAVLVGLLLVRITRVNMIDSIIAIAVAFYILKLAYDMVYKSVSGLIDSRLSPTDEAIIKKCLAERSHDVVDYHELRTRKSGSHHYIDLHVVMDRELSLEQAHQVCDEIEDKIQNCLPGTNVTIHVEPCQDECEECRVLCSKNPDERSSV